MQLSHARTLLKKSMQQAAKTGSLESMVALQRLEEMTKGLSFQKDHSNGLQEGFTNFYAKDTISPYVPVAGFGPWILTEQGKVVYDSGGYGMLGFGHSPVEVLEALSKPQVMANIMTPSHAQKNFWRLLEPELKPAYSTILCLNSGSEANTIAMRIANIHDHERPVRVSMSGSFHGRTELPATVSGSCVQSYRRNLSDYKQMRMDGDDESNPERMGVTYYVDPNNEKHLEEVFATIRERGEFPEVTLFEPVMGEGNPGVPIERGFYDAMRELSANAGGLLLADSVQAGFRVTGELSVTKYPWMEGAVPPDMETFSKAINGGQFPLSVLALSEELGKNYTSGIYGNTMTANPRGLDVGSSVLRSMTPDVRKNVRETGLYFKEKLATLAEKYEELECVTGTGLLLALHIRPDIPVLDLEYDLRVRGLNAIHGGPNGLRFTPWFKMDATEVDFVIDILDEYFAEKFGSVSGEIHHRASGK